MTSSDSETPNTSSTPPTDGDPTITSTPHPVADPATVDLRHDSSDDLPEDFEITPEYVEEEAVRGDFVIRWAAILLAVLMGCTHIASTTTLVRIRTGEALAADGLLPHRTDVLSYTATERPWANLSWLGDLLLAGVYGVGGDLLLSVLGAVLSGLAFWLISQCSRPGVSTWWGSICAGLATIAVFPLLTPGPTLMTVLGFSLVLFIVQRWQNDPETSGLWWLAPVLLIWSNTDSRAFLGVLFIVLFAIGFSMAQRGNFPLRRLWAPVGAAVLAAFLHPFPLDVATAPYRLLAVDYPLLREFPGTNPAEVRSLWRPVFDGAAWQSPSWSTLACVLVGAAAVGSFVLNRRRTDWALLVPFVGLNAYALQSGIDFAAVTLVNAVVATLNAQMWYRHNWRQEYSVDPRELLLGRVGRAVTVLGLFFSAYWLVSGHMTGASGRRVGFGFSHWLTAQVDGYRDLLGEIPDDELDDQPFHITPQQGDVLIWLKRRSFTDSRLALFAQGDTNLLEAQRDIATLLNSSGRTLETSDQISEWARDWNQRLDDFGLTHVIVPLDSMAGYRLWVDMASQAAVIDNSVVRYWQLVDVGGPAAVLYRLQASPELVNSITKFLSRKTLGSVEGVIGEVFRPQTVGSPVQRDVFPRSPTFYETSLLLPEPVVSNEILVARHYATRLGAGNRSVAESLAYCHKIIRHARKGLADHPDSFEGYLLLGDTFGRLWQTELALTDRNPIAVMAAERRFFEAIFALHHAAIRNPSSPDPHAALYAMYFQHGDYDLALKHLDRVFEMTGYYTARKKDEPGFSQLHQEGKQLREQLHAATEQARKLIEQAQAEGNLAMTIGTAIQMGCPGTALELLERDLTVVVGDPMLSDQHAALLLLVGRTEEGFDQILRLHAALDNESQTQTLRTLAKAYMASDNQDRVAELWAELGESRRDRLLDAYLGSLPLLTQPAPQNDAWPILQLMAGFEGLARWEPEWEESEWQIAMCHLEQGRNVDAVQTLQSLLTFSPRTPLRPLSATYLTLLTGQDVPFTDPDAAAPADAAPTTDDAPSTQPPDTQPSDAQPSDTQPSDTQSPASQAPDTNPTPTNPAATNSSPESEAQAPRSPPADSPAADAPQSNQAL